MTGEGQPAKSSRLWCGTCLSALGGFRQRGPGLRYGLQTQLPGRLADRPLDGAPRPSAGALKVAGALPLAGAPLGLAAGALIVSLAGDKELGLVRRRGTIRWAGRGALLLHETIIYRGCDRYPWHGCDLPINGGSV